MTTCTPLPASAFRIDRQRRDQRLALAGAHLGDLAVVQHHAADQLHVEGPHADGAARRLARRGEGLGEDLVERLAGDEPGTQRIRARTQCLVTLRRKCIGELVCLLDAFRVLAQQALVTAAE